jgi:predicted O-methyltransferase YrrM
MTAWKDFVDAIDDSDPMTTAREHIAMICEAVEGREWNILELGSHAGISTAAIALAAPESKITSVDLCDTVQEAMRLVYWASNGVTNITPVAGTAEGFLRTCLPGQFDVVFHDAVHGPAAFSEYLACVEITRILFIHDFEQLPEDMQEAIRWKFPASNTNTDAKGRVLFWGYK